ncbi:MAG: hypothetical protein NTV51_28845 [Verrucomicrobia bacterium]|nr:hypothetical protein [Verrucomicrobiota bacterium]
MKRFAYARDPLCLLACAGYALNRWALRPVGWAAGPFMRGHFNDLLLIPAALPLLLWLQRRLGLRAADGPPSWREIALHLVVWSVAAEAIAPQLWHHATGDWLDVAAYATGAVVAGCWWHASTPT